MWLRWGLPCGLFLQFEAVERWTLLQLIIRILSACTLSFICQDVVKFSLIHGVA